MENKNSEGSRFFPIRLAGDVMLGRLVNEIIDRKNYRYPWGNVLPILQQDGVNIINLETTLTNSKKRVNKVFNFKASPDKIKCLTEAKIDLVNLANNHILDFSVDGLLETIEILDTAGIQHVGAGKNKAEATKPAIIKKFGLNIGVIGTTDNEPSWKATELPGTNYVKVGDLDALEKSIVELRPQVDLLILSAHWGPNMVQRPSSAIRNFAHELIDLGVDMIHGHSAHVFQGIEIYKEGLILYDTGDFIDDYVVNPSLRNDRSFLFQLNIGHKVQGIKLIPVKISNMQVNIAEGQDYEWCMAKMYYLSQEFSTVMSEEGEVYIRELTNL